MKKNVARTILVLLAVGIIGYFAFMSYVSSQMHASKSSTWEAMKSSVLECPSGTEVKTEGWSKLGYSRTCINLRHGKWEAWSEGYKHIDGYYEHGKKHGKWVFYNSDGSVSNEVEYNQGVEVAITEKTKGVSE